MRTFFSILLISLFFFSQFGKVINFGLCTITAYQQNGSFDCISCTIQLADITAAEQSKPVSQRTIAVPSFDELFHPESISTVIQYHAPFNITYPHNKAELLYDCYQPDIFHPPA